MKNREIPTPSPEYHLVVWFFPINRRYGFKAQESKPACLKNGVSNKAALQGVFLGCLF